VDNTPAYIDTPDKKPSKAKTIWLVLIILALIASNVSWALFFLKQQGELNTKITILTAQNAKLAKDNKSLQSENDKLSSASTVSGDYREIPEFGVKYKVTDEIKKLTYAYDEQLTNFPTVTFTNISSAGRPQSYSPPNITQYTDEKFKTETGSSGSLETYVKKNPKDVRTIGKYTYVLTTSAGAGQTPTDEYTKNLNTLTTEIFNSLLPS